MKVIDSIKSDRDIISVEIEPPSVGRGIDEVFTILDPLVDAGITHVDITYHPEQIIRYVGENGEQFPIAQRKKPGTAGVAGALLGRYRDRGVEPVPHVICTGFTAHNTEEYLIELAFLGIKNVLALRGDAAKGPDGSKMPFRRVPGGHEHGNEIIEQIANLRHGHYVGAQEGYPINFCIGAACYPEGYTEYADPNEEIEWLKVKVGSGADYLVTQMFFDTDKYKRFVDRLREADINVPIVPGIKPLTTSRQLDILPRIFLLHHS